MGSVGDSYDNALSDPVIGLFKTELIRRRGPWRDLEAVEFANAARTTVRLVGRRFAGTDEFPSTTTCQLRNIVSAQLPIGILESEGPLDADASTVSGVLPGRPNR